jgi:hypothetical protein
MSIQVYDDMPVNGRSGYIKNRVVETGRWHKREKPTQNIYNNGE